MKNKLSKKETEEKINEIFSNNPSKSEIKKIKRLAMSKNIKLGDYKKLFCKKCYSNKLRVKKISKEMKTLECRDCGYVSRWKI